MPANSKDKVELCKQLWENCEPRLRQLCQRKLDSYPHEIDEVIADAYLILCNALLGDGKEIAYPVGWLYGTVNNLIKEKYTEMNKRKALNQSLFDYNTNLMYDVPYNVDYLDVIIKYKYEDAILESLYDGMTSEERELIELIYEKNTSYKEAAEIYGSTESAIKQRVYRIRKRVRADMIKKLKNCI